MWGVGGRVHLPLAAAWCLLLTSAFPVTCGWSADDDTPAAIVYSKPNQGTGFVGKLVLSKVGTLGWAGPGRVPRWLATTHGTHTPPPHTRTR